MSTTFSKKASTEIYQAIPCEHNPYIAKEARLSGYNVLDLMEKKPFIDVIFLLLSGELPSGEQSIFLNKLMVGFINLGVQHPAIRAAMTAGISKSNTEHILPIGLMVLGGNERGAKSVEEAYHFIKKNMDDEPSVIAENSVSGKPIEAHVGDVTIAPGFGSCFGDIDIVSNDVGNMLSGEPACGRAMTWSKKFSDTLHPYSMSWLPSAIVASAGIDLELGARESLALFQLMCSPGIVAQGVEQTHKPITAMPFLADEDYNYVGS